MSFPPAENLGKTEAARFRLATSIDEIIALPVNLFWESLRGINVGNKRVEKQSVSKKGGKVGVKGASAGGNLNSTNGRLRRRRK